ncbi:methyltransferase domain-containing protein [Nostocoides sp. F2B08]|uniref:class I SAM-dependent methyltransferase n=1 Tax=Nostocoides sp. F2B08 TaxID=2653936 RepID=UPI0012632221|nr:class I SAM-dependent methyltransferase [Tetrasphaera sp. F2B08]KAB7739798.1 methyltransferase domain-containing protein [Tetrasphaera sp. F2B08]
MTSEQTDDRHTEDRRRIWNERYGAAERVWSSGPNEHVAEIVGSMAPGTALDLGAGEGRHAIWLAESGWTATAVDFAEIGLDRGRHEAEQRGLGDRLTWVTADVTTWAPAEGTEYDLVLVAYLHLPEDVFGRAATWVAPGGHLVVVGHALRNLTEGVGGPQDPAILNTPDQLREKARGLQILRCEEVERTTTDGATAIDVALVARRPT